MKKFSKKPLFNLCSAFLLLAATVISNSGSFLLMGEPVPPKSLIR